MEIVPFISLEAALREKKISMITYERVKVAKEYIEKKYRLKKEEEEEKKKDWDEIISRMNELKLPEEEATKIKDKILHKESENLRKKRQKISIFDFEPLKIIGKGAFGEVRVCRHIPTNDILAIKKMKKDEMHIKNQVLHVRAERDVLSQAKNEWIVNLKFSFQDQKYLYLGMDYLPGGDLMSLLMARDILPEEDAKFYSAELVLAIEYIHNMGCIHRDLKPDNVLIDKDGHIKLSDFGLSKKLDMQELGQQIYKNYSGNIRAGNSNNGLNNVTYAEQFSAFKNMKNKLKRAMAFSTVGTPDYIAPEVFMQKGYGQEIDWWSLGVIMFEMMIGYPPFFSDSSTETCKKILDWKNNLKIRKEVHISKEAEDILLQLINDCDKRLGRNGVNEIKNHPYFKGIDWNNIKSTLVPPFIPELSSPYDTKYFDNFEEDEPFYPSTKENNYGKKKYTKKDMCFVDFTYNRENDIDYRNNMVTALEVFDSIQENIKRIKEEERLNNMNNDNNDNDSNNKPICNNVIVNEDNFSNNINNIFNNENIDNTNYNTGTYIPQQNKMINFKNPKSKEIKELPKEIEHYDHYIPKKIGKSLSKGKNKETKLTYKKVLSIRGGNKNSITTITRPKSGQKAMNQKIKLKQLIINNSNMPSNISNNNISNNNISSINSNANNINNSNGNNNNTCNYASNICCNNNSFRHYIPISNTNLNNYNRNKLIQNQNQSDNIQIPNEKGYSKGKPPRKLEINFKNEANYKEKYIKNTNHYKPISNLCKNGNLSFQIKDRYNTSSINNSTYVHKNCNKKIASPRLSKLNDNTKTIPNRIIRKIGDPDYIDSKQAYVIQKKY